jgi:putative ABC transport system permease protein
MIKNYLKIAFRNLIKQKTLAFINIFGLSVGVACFSLFALYALNEFNFEDFNKNAGNIYRVYTFREAFNGNDSHGNVYMPLPLGPSLKNDIPAVEDYVRVVQPFETFIQTPKGGSREKVGYADPSFFSIFSMKLKHGNPATALQGTNSIVLTEDAAKKIFGSSEIIGKAIEVKLGNQFQPFIVTAVAENPPSNSSFQFDIIAPMQRWADAQNILFGTGSWNWASYITFVQLKPGSSLAQTKMVPPSFRAKYFPDEEKDARKYGWSGKGPAYSYRLEPLRDVHTDINLPGLKVAPIDPKMVWILLGIAGAILLIACINFTTLSLGRSAGRAKEVGIRKVSGGTKRALIFQFLTESLILAIISTIIGLLMADMLLPYFNGLSGRELSFSITQFPQLLLVIVVTVILVGLLSGSYPALVLSGFRASEVLKAKIKLGGSNFFTKSLVTFQFIISTALIISSVVIIRQIHFMESRYPGFDKENVVVVNATGVASSINNLYGLFKQEIASCPDILATGGAGNGLGEGQGMLSMGFDYQKKSISTNVNFIEPDFIPALGMRMIAGRNFDPSISSDTLNAVIINETLMHELGWELSKAIGKHIEGYGNFGFVNPEVIGVVKDFNYMKASQQIEPMLLYEHHGTPPIVWKAGYFFMRIKAGNPSKALAAIQAAWKKLAPEYPVKYKFLDEDLNRFYESETKLSAILSSAGGIAVFLACLGLFGLVILSVVNRTKEIGIRKVLGASIATIINILSKDFLKLVVIALIIATPIAWIIMNKWLQDYAYRVELGWWVFAITGAAIIAIAFLTMLFHAVKAAIKNPVESLRTE